MKRTFLILIGASLLSMMFTPEADKKQLNEMIDNWHISAAKADLKAYFEPMTDDFIYLGTDPEERWTKSQFESFCKPYFEKGEAWDFKSTERNWVFDSSGNVAWFDERLNTWMEECRGSGVVVKKNGKWKLAYYNLTVLIENDKIKSFVELRKK